MGYLDDLRGKGPTRRIAVLLCVFSLAALMLMSSVASIAADVNTPTNQVWDGTADVSWYNDFETEFIIETPEQLAGLAQIVNGDAEDIGKDSFAGKTITLASDVYLNATTVSEKTEGQRTWTPIGRDQFNHGGKGNTTQFDMIFRGTFDGGGHTVYNIYIFGPDAPHTKLDDMNIYGGNQGFFGILGEGAIIKNLGVTGYLQGRVVGGIAAATCIQEQTPANRPQIISCYNAATIYGDGSGDRGTGGIFGGQDRDNNWLAFVDITDCYNVGRISAISTNAIAPVGGIAGVCDGHIKNCYNAGIIIKGKYSAGVSANMGIATENTNHGFAFDGSIENCYALTGASELLYKGHDYEGAQPPYRLIVAEHVDEISSFKTADELRGMAQTLGAAWADDTANINDGYPILAWQVKPIPTLVASTPSASVVKLTGKQNEISITITEVYSDGSQAEVTWSGLIDNNAAGTYSVGNYQVFVDTKGNDQIRDCRIVE